MYILRKIREYAWVIIVGLVVIGGFVGIIYVIEAGTDNLIQAIQERRDKQLRLDGCKEVINTGVFKGRDLLDLRDQCREIIRADRAQQQAKQDDSIQEFIDAMQEVR